MYQRLEELGPPAGPQSVPASSGIPRAIIDLTLRGAVQRPRPRSRRCSPNAARTIAGMIIEPVMMNAGIIPPLPGYLEGVRERHPAPRRAARLRRGEDRRARSGPGGATRRFGVTPDIVCLAKAMGGGIAMRRRRGNRRGHGRTSPSGDYEQVGTFNGNPMAMAAARAALTEVLTDDAYAHFDRLRSLHGRRVRGDDRRLRPPGPRGRARREGVRRVLAQRDPELPRLPGDRRPVQPPALADPAQRRRVPAPVGQGGAVDALRAAHGGRRPAVPRQLRARSRRR